MCPARMQGIFSAREISMEDRNNNKIEQTNWTELPVILGLEPNHYLLKWISQLINRVLFDSDFKQLKCFCGSTFISQLKNHSTFLGCFGPPISRCQNVHLGICEIIIKYENNNPFHTQLLVFSLSRYEIVPGAVCIITFKISFEA